MGHVAGTMKTRDVGLNLGDVNPTFDSKVGFTYKRPERKALIGDSELSSARIPIKYRDYCAHLLMDYHVCRYKVFPLLYRCHHEKHAYLNCEHDDYVVRMKEFERERRLRHREIRIKEGKPRSPDEDKQCEDSEKQAK